MVYDLIAQYNSGPNSELVYNIPLTTGDKYKFYIAYQLEVPDLRKEDFIVVGCTWEITQHLPYEMMVGHYLIATKTQADTATNNPVICPPHGFDVIADHAFHEDRHPHGTLVIPEDGYQYVTQVIYAASTRALPGDYTVLQKGYGRLWVLHYREH